ncbi:MAG: hypothetical protein AAGA00_08500 [Pseudomonadota bacterium]
MSDTLLDRIVALTRSITAGFRFRSDSFPIDRTERLADFTASRAAFVCQKKLYGYLKQRIGTRWPSMFEDEVFKSSIATASMQIFAACLSDLTIHTVAHALAGSGEKDEVKSALARDLYARALLDNQADATEGFDIDQVIAEFDLRLDGTDWNFGALLPENFTRSPGALLRWAPIAERYKKSDAEIVENSLKFAWVDIREQFARRLDANAIAREVSESRSGAEG